MKKIILLLSLIILIGSTQNKLKAETKKLYLSLQTIDPKTNQLITKTEEVDASKIGVIIVDPWNFHWCMTACERVSAMVPRWNRAIEVARKLGMPVFWMPSDIVGMYSGYPQRERALGVKLVPVLNLREMPKVEFTAKVGSCMCGPGFSCKVNYGWDGINPDLFVADEDYIAATTDEVYSLLREKGITHILYMGLHTNMCLFEKPGALKYMWQTGMTCMIARDINDANTNYNPVSSFTPDQGTKQTDEDLQRAGVPMINVVDEWKKAGMWDDKWIVETVRIVPWGKPKRPYFFEQSTTVTLTTPWLKDVDVRYTLDGSEPTKTSSLYQNPLLISETTTLRTAAFRSGRIVSIPTDAYFVHLPPQPQQPDVNLQDLNYIIDPFAQLNDAYCQFFWHPKRGKSFEDLPLRVREKVYEKGLGFRAPSAVRYEIKPEYDRFVARVGIDENMLDHLSGGLLAQHSSVVFRIFIDGKMMAESPVMRMSQEPWRFDVKIPEGSRYINLACMDAGSRNVLDFGDWIDSGFCIK
jgi:nicotinamidase-related amidase